MTNNNYTVIGYDVPERDRSRVHWSGWIDTPRAGRTNIEFHFDYPTEADFQPSTHPWILAFLLPAMREGFPLKIPYRADKVLLNNLMEWQEAWVAWRPGRLKVVPLLADAIVDADDRMQSEDKAITCFSGGVDSCFTCCRHTVVGPTLYRRTPLKAGLMVHGFDIPLERDEEFQNAFSRSQRFLHERGLNCLSMRTTLRKLSLIFDVRWGVEAHGAWLAACLMCYADLYSSALIPSTYPYAKMKFPWASNPITDPLLSMSGLRILHDGAAYNKLQKVEVITRNAEVRASLRVCWEGRRLDRNCGHCFKCVATQVCFWIQGIPNAQCFPEPCQLKDVAAIQLKNAENYYLFQRLAQGAEKRGMTELQQTLQSCLGQSPAPGEQP